MQSGEPRAVSMTGALLPLMVEYIQYRMPVEHGDRFAETYEQAGEVLARSPHCRGWELRRSVEEPERFVVRIEWDSQEGHEEGFRGSPDFEQFLALVRPFAQFRGEMAHYDAVASREDGVATIAPPGDGEALWGLGGLWIIRVSAARTGGGFSLLEVRMRQGSATPLHRHSDDEETFIVLEGQLALLVQEQRVDAGPGAVVYLPGGEIHAWRVESEEARFLIIATPQHEAFYRECCEPAAALTQPPDAGQIDLSIIIPAGKRHGVEIISPPPAY
jgi:quercetin dioxygenase-like cupin family protein/heme-degrading monooxygenase HmoA